MRVARPGVASIDNRSRDAVGRARHPLNLALEANMTDLALRTRDTGLAIRTLDGASKRISHDIVTALRSKLRGTVALPGRRDTRPPGRSGMR